jgi:hypothetical protein
MDRPENEQSVLKIFNKSQQKAFMAEQAVLNRLGSDNLLNCGFPRAESVIEGLNSSEILFEALGKDLK